MTDDEREDLPLEGLRALLPFLVKSGMSILGNNCMQSTASAAGYPAGAAMVSRLSRPTL